MPKGDRAGLPWGGGAGVGGMRGSISSFGPVSQCACPNCGAKVPCQLYMPCYNLTCPHCGSRMVNTRHKEGIIRSLWLGSEL